MARKSLGIITAATFTVCRFKNTNEDSDRVGTVHGFIHSPSLRRILSYRVVFIDNQFRSLNFGEHCADMGSLAGQSEYMSEYYYQRWGDLQTSCIEDADWAAVADIVLSDMPSVSRGTGRKRLKELLDQQRDRCFSG